MKKINDLTRYLSKRGFSKEASYLNSLAYNKYENNDKSLLSQIMNGTSFSSEIIPQKISSIPSDLQQFCASKGRSDVSFKSNGVLRDLAETLRGGAARDPGSYHGLGLAHDLIILTPKNNNKYPGIGENTSIIKKDPELVKLMKEYAESRNLTWGGNFSRGRAFTLPTGETVHDTELHHFEIPKKDMDKYVHPIVKEILGRRGISISDLSSSAGRQKAYRLILSIISGDEETEDGIAQSGGTQGNSGVTNNIDSNKRLIDSNLSDREIEEENYDWLMDERRSLFEGVDFNNLSKSDKIMIDMMGKALKVT